VAVAGRISLRRGQNSLAQGEDGTYSNRSDRRLADITTKAAIPEIDFLWDSLTHVQCPALVMRGARSPILDAEISGLMVRSLPHGQLYVFKDTGHSLPRLRPEGFASAVRAFLNDDPLP
jgi:pimeloyl-ACP methyl ester carboxylesterase